MNESTIHADAVATITRLQAKHSELKQELAKSWGFAVFPYVGRASAVLGGAYGHGEVFEQGKSVGFATISQMTLGVQIGGQTFSEVVLFPKKKALDEFRTGKVAFTANASAVLVKAAASGTSNFSGVTAHAYSRGGMLLELSLGGQKFMFVPPTKPLSQAVDEQWPGDSEKAEEPTSDESEKREARDPGGSENQEERASNGSEEEDGQASNGSEEEDGQASNGSEEEEGRASNGSEQEGRRASAEPSESKEEGGESSGGHGFMKGLKKVGSQLVGKVRKAGEHVPILKKEADISRQLHVDVVATLQRMKAKDPSLEKKLEEAYGYVVYPTVGRASLVLGCSFGKGEVFKGGKLDGYAGLVQLTLGVQVGGQTYSQLVLLQDKEAFKRFKQGKLGFAANLSTVIVKAGAAATNNYKGGMQIYAHSEGGLALEAVIGLQKLIYRHAGLMLGKPADRDKALELGRSRPAVELAGEA